MQNSYLPQSANLTTRHLNRVFDKTVATYKYYWFLGILDLFVKQGKTRMNVWEIMISMVVNAWYPVNYFRLSFGKSESLYDAILTLQKELPEDWTLNNLLGKHRSRPYNPDIANVFFRAGEIEAWGRGIERIVAACKKNGYPEPQFDYDGGGLWTIFHFGKEYVDTTQKTIQKKTKLQIDIIEYLKKAPYATQKEMAENIDGATLGSVKYSLIRLQKNGYIRRIGPDKSGFWEIIE